MDLATKEQFKWKFYRLVVMLNIILVLVAVAVIVLFLAAEEYRIPLFTLLVLSAIVFTVYFWFQYRRTREWLHNQG
jgi:L-asparagine transporter-like permease